MDYRPDIDGLRAIAVLPVVFYHAGVVGFTGGYVGVDIFFVISGFLITTIIYRVLAEGQFSILRFYERRARRILPALFAVILATLVAGLFLLMPADYDQMGQSILSALFFVSNMWFWQNSGGYFDGATDYLPMLHTWSLAVEEQFYIFFPLLLMALHRIGRRLLLPFILVLVVGSLVLAGWATPRMPSASFYLLPTRIWELGVGSLLALGLVRTEAPRMVRETIGALGLVGVLAPVFLYNSTTVFPGVAALPPVLGAAALIWAGTAGPVWASRLLSLRPMVWIGLISYSLYLWHWPIMAFVRNRLFTVELEPTWQLGTVLASVLASWISWRFVERPFRVPLRSGGMTQRRIFVLSGAGMAVLGALAGAIFLTGGMATQRFSDAQLAALPQEPLRNAHRDRCFGPRPAERFCTFGNTDQAAPVEWFLWGDSHADAMLPALIDLAEAHNVKLAFAGHPTCIPLPGLLRTNGQGRVNTSCLQFNRAAFDFVEMNPSIKVVFLHARWAIYTDGFYGYDRTGDVILYEESEEPPETVDYAQNAALVEATLGSLVEGILQPDRGVVLIGPTPEVRWDVPRHRAAEILFGWPVPPAPTPDEVLARQAVSSGILARVAAKTDSIYIPMAQSICAEECVLFTETQMYYTDEHHFSVPGARLEARPLLEQGLAEILNDQGGDGT